MDRKAIARETLEIMRQGYYVLPGGKRVEIGEELKRSVSLSRLITPEQGAGLMREGEEETSSSMPVCAERHVQNRGKDEKKIEYDGDIRLENISAVEAIRKLAQEGKEDIGVLNFASAKNPGGGFINGAMAQEESLAASGTLYRTLIAHEEYYRENRAKSSMMYTDYAIYSPDVIFFGTSSSGWLSIR